MLHINYTFLYFYSVKMAYNHSAIVFELVENKRLMIDNNKSSFIYFCPLVLWTLTGKQAAGLRDNE